MREREGCAPATVCLRSPALKEVGCGLQDRGGSPQSLRDGRAVYIDGELVADVTTHPAFRNAVQAAAALYDYQARPENLERMTFTRAGEGGYRRDQPRLADAAQL